jgi:hypothetical protein
VTVVVLRDERACVAAADDAVTVDVIRAAVTVLEAVEILRECRALVNRLVAQPVAVHVRIARVAEAVTIEVSLVPDQRVAGLSGAVCVVGTVVGSCAANGAGRGPRVADSV